MAKIEEILGFQSGSGKDSETVTRRYFVTLEPAEQGNPALAKNAFESYAKSLTSPTGLELTDVSLDEEKSSSDGLFYGTITFAAPSPKIKTVVSTDIQELYGDKNSAGRKSASRERAFRIKANDAVSAREKLENYIRANAVTSGRLHIAEITADENASGDGFFMGRVSYSNPDTHASRDKMNGIVPSYGGRISANKNSISTERVFELRGFANYDAAYTALKNNYGWYSDVDSIDVEENSEGAFQLYTGRVKYLTEKEEDDAPQNSVSFEVSGTQTKMTHSLRTRSGFAASGSPRNYGGLIGVTDDGVEGVDVDTAVSTFTETVHFKPWFLTTQYIAFLGHAYGCVNTAPFRGFSDGEVRFLGASGSYRRGDKSVEMTFKFAVSPNARNIRIGEMTIPFKYGWDYLWVRWADMKKGNITVKTPVEAYVEQVYQGLNFGTLGIGF